MAFKLNNNVVAGTLNGVNSGSYYNGPAQPMARVKVGTLSAHITADIETDSLTAKVSWQGSNTSDFDTAYDLALNELNAADSSATALATGTSGADAAVTRIVPAPDAAYSFRFVRARLLVGGANGTSSDTVSIGYSYRT